MVNMNTGGLDVSAALGAFFSQNRKQPGRPGKLVAAVTAFKLDIKRGL
jgi:hypothetical protein